MAGSTPQGHDILRVLESEEIGSPARVTGFVAESKVYGGDGASVELGGGELCALEIPADPEFHQKTSYEAGIAVRSVLVEPCDDTDEILQTLHQEVDADAGLISRIYDSADFGVSLSYDAMGRLVREQPDQGAVTLHLYSVPTIASGITTPAYQVERCDPNFGGNDCPNDYRRFSSHSTYYDGLGRPISEAVAYPAEGNSELDQSRSSSRDVLGRTTFESTWQPPLGAARFQRSKPRSDCFQAQLRSALRSATICWEK